MINFSIKPLQYLVAAFIVCGVLSPAPISAAQKITGFKLTGSPYTKKYVYWEGGEKYTTTIRWDPPYIHEDGGIGERSVAINDSGKFVATWLDWEGYINYRLFNSKGRSISDGYVSVKDMTVVSVYESYHDESFRRKYKRRAYAPAAAMDKAGNFIAVWRAGGHTDIKQNKEWINIDKDEFIMGRLYDAVGHPQGEPFQINQTNSIGCTAQEWECRTMVAMTPDGNFVVAWARGEKQDKGYGLSIMARSYDRSGKPLGDEFMVRPPLRKATREYGAEYFFDMVMDANGNFMVAWDEDPPPTETPDVKVVVAQRFDAFGHAIGQIITILNRDMHSYNYYDLAMTPSGDFIVGWFETPSDLLWVRRFDANGNSLGPILPIKTGKHIVGLDPPQVASDAQGNFVVVWLASPKTDDEDDFVLWNEARFFNAQGKAKGKKFRLTAINGFQCSIAMNGGGDMVAIWNKFKKLKDDGDYGYEYIVDEGYGRLIKKNP